MKHSEIAATAAYAAARAASAGDPSAEQIAKLETLYDYARDRKFPPPETLARKSAELDGMRFPMASLDEAPEPIRTAFTVFRAVAAALEPFYEPDPDPATKNALQPAPAATQPADPQALDTQQKDQDMLDPEKAEQGTDEAVDEIEAKRRVAQAETDKVIAESGGKFLEDTPAQADPEPKKKSK